MNKIKFIISSTALAGVVLTTSLLSSVQAQEKTIAALKPISSWSAKAIAAGTDNGYCALSRQYDQNLVLTLGQNMTEEYSLAIDFTDASLNPDKAYSITLQPGPGQIRAYEMMPASTRALVIRLGYDERFLESLNESGLLKVEIDGKNYHFNVGEFAKGEADLKRCMQGLKGGPTTKIASSGFSAKKIENAPPMKALKIAKAPQKTKIIAPQPTPKVEIERAPKVAAAVKKAPRPPIEIERVASVQETPKIIDAPQKPVIIEAVEMPQEPLKPIVMNKVASRISKAISLDPVTPSDKAKTHMEAQKIATEQATKKVEDQAKKTANAKAKELEEKAIQIAQKRQLEEKKIAANKAEKVKLTQEKFEQEKLEKIKLAKVKAEQQKLAQEKAGKEKLEKTKLAQAKADQEKLAEKKQEEQRLAKDVAKKKADKKLKEEKVAAAKIVKQAELKETQTRLQELEKENRALYLEARSARGAIDTAVIDAGSQALVKIREYEKKLNAAKSDNLALSKEMEELRQIKESGRLEVVAGDWDLEKSTRRYNEAEREIKRLGLLLEQQRTAHRQERGELEQMLFDPAVADQAQRRRLSDLESKLATVQRQLRTSGGSPQQSNIYLSDMPAVPAPSVPRAPMEERVALAPTPRPSGIPSIVESQREQMEINRLNSQIKRQGQQLQAYKRQAESQKAEAVKAVKVAKAPVPSFPRVEETAPRISSAPRISRALDSSLAALSPVQAVPIPEPVLAIRNIPSPSLPKSSKNKIQKILNKAGVGVDGRISESSSGQYQWKSGQLKGQAQVVSMAQGGSVDQLITSFMAKSKSACQGDFASLPAPNIGNAKAFEVACIAPTSNTSSSLIFMQSGEDIVMIGHEISADDMDVAMDVRDRIAGSL
jgi:hypothetical protein